MDTKQFHLREKTLGNLLDEVAERYPDNEAVYYANQDVRQTWSQFAREVDILAKSLMALGVKKNEKVAIWATNEPHWLTLMFATAKIGSVLVPVNTSYRNQELLYLLQASDTETLFIGNGFRDHNFFDTLYDVVPELKHQEAGKTTINILPQLKRVIALDKKPHEGILSYHDIVQLADSVSDEAYTNRQKEVSPDEVVNMQFTSGTTGFPKGVMLSHSNILNNGYWIGHHQNLGHTDTVCLPVPFFHCFGCVLGVMACVNHAAKMVVIESFDPSIVLSQIESEQCTAAYGVPTMFLSLLEHKRFATTNVSTLRTGIMAGSVCPEPLMRRVISEMNLAELTICYGLTEGSPVLTQTHADEEFIYKVSSVGRPMPGIDVKVVDSETGEEMPRGKAGEVVCKGYNVMQGYYKNPKATATAIIDGWLHTGDLGIMDEKGYLIITGRIKDMILRGGENIYPREIEEYLSHMPEIFDIQVVGVPSRKYGEEVAAFIIAREGSTLTPAKIRAYCKGNIAWQKVPKHIVFIDAFPMTASGKIQKYVLREQAAEKFAHLMNE